MDLHLSLTQKGLIGENVCHVFFHTTQVTLVYSLAFSLKYFLSVCFGMPSNILFKSGANSQLISPLIETDGQREKKRERQKKKEERVSKKEGKRQLKKEGERIIFREREIHLITDSKLVHQKYMKLYGKA